MTAGRLAIAFFAMGMLALVVGTLVPAVIDAQAAEERETALLEEGDSKIYDDVVEIEMVAVDNSGGSVNVSVRDVETQEHQEIGNLSVGETKSVTLTAGEVKVTLEEIESGNSADVTPSFSRTFGWNDGAVLFIDELDTMLTLVGALMLIGALAQVGKG